MTKIATHDHALQYAQDVVAGRIVACQFVQLACQRHLSDLQDGAARGLFFDERKANHMLRWFATLPHVRGPLARPDPRTGRKRCIELAPWQAFSIAVPFAWRRFTDEAAEMFGADESVPESWPRRFTTIYEEVARKNAKTTKGAGLALYMMALDGEHGAEVYAAATKADQAKISWQIAADMVRRSPFPGVRKLIQHNTYRIACRQTDSFFLPLSADGKTQDGTNPYYSLVDELHAHKTRDVLETIETGMGARASAVLHAITTAGEDLTGLCFEMREYAAQVLAGALVDDAFFALIYTQDKSDYTDDDGNEDWEKLFSDTAVWRKSNPGLGDAVSVEKLRDQVNKARNLPAARSALLKKRFNIWYASDDAWIPPDAWHSLDRAQPLGELANERVMLGLDLSKRRDLTAYIRLFLTEPVWQVHCKFYMPHGALADQPRLLRKRLEAWAEEGHLILTPGATMDQRRIRDQVRADREQFELVEACFDPWNVKNMQAELLDEGVPCVQVPQTPKVLSDAMKDTEDLITTRQLAHDHNPIMLFCMANVRAHPDKNDNLFPNKADDQSKIDGATAFITVMARAALYLEEKPSVYKSRGLLDIYAD